MFSILVTSFLCASIKLINVPKYKLYWDAVTFPKMTFIACDIYNSAVIIRYINFEVLLSAIYFNKFTKGM